MHFYNVQKMKESEAHREVKEALKKAQKQFEESKVSKLLLNNKILIARYKLGEEFYEVIDVNKKTLIQIRDKKITVKNISEKELKIIYLDDAINVNVESDLCLKYKNAKFSFICNPREMLLISFL